MQFASFILSIVALIVAGLSAYYAHQKADTSKKALQYTKDKDAAEKRAVLLRRAHVVMRELAAGWHHGEAVLKVGDKGHVRIDMAELKELRETHHSLKNNIEAATTAITLAKLEVELNCLETDTKDVVSRVQGL